MLMFDKILGHKCQNEYCGKRIPKDRVGTYDGYFWYCSVYCKDTWQKNYDAYMEYDTSENPLDKAIALRKMKELDIKFTEEFAKVKALRNRKRQ